MQPNKILHYTVICSITILPRSVLRVTYGARASYVKRPGDLIRACFQGRVHKAHKNSAVRFTDSLAETETILLSHS
jgi:hypothetical protein